MDVSSSTRIRFIGLKQTPDSSYRKYVHDHKVAGSGLFLHLSKQNTENHLLVVWLLLPVLVCECVFVA